MDISAMARTEWHDLHTLGRPARHLIHEASEHGDVHPFATAIDHLHATEVLVGR